MPAQGEELDAAREEGVELVELVSPRRVVTRLGRVTGLECARMRLGPPDASGRPRPEEVPGAVMELELDTLVVAIGQRARLGYLDGAGVAVTRVGFLEVDPETLETSLARRLRRRRRGRRRPGHHRQGVRRRAPHRRRHPPPGRGLRAGAAPPRRAGRARAPRPAGAPGAAGSRPGAADPTARIGFAEVVGGLAARGRGPRGGALPALRPHVQHLRHRLPQPGAVHLALRASLGADGRARALERRAGPGRGARRSPSTSRSRSRSSPTSATSAATA